MEFAAVAIAISALAFTIGSFWWLHARRGSLEAGRPHAYAFAKKVRLRVPFAFFNTGARALIVEDLRVVFEEPARPPLPWITTRRTLRPETDDGFAYATPFAVPGRATREFIVEFGDDLEWEPEFGRRHLLRLQARIHGGEEWVGVVDFEWWAPPPGAKLGAYLTYRNEQPS